MAATEEASDTTVRQRRSNHSMEQAVSEQNVDASSHNNNLSEWNRHLEGLKAEVVGEISTKLRRLLDKAMKEAAQSNKNEAKTAKTRPQKGPQSSMFERKKVFEHRASILDDLMEVEHFRTIYHMFVAALCVFVISTLALEITEHGRVVLEFELLTYTFGQFDKVAWCWICLFTYTLLIPYKTLCFWGSLYPKSNHKFLLNAFTCIFLLVCQTGVLFVFPVYVVIIYQLPPASSFTVILESLRLLMKSYAFLRESVPVVLHAEKKEILLPKFSSYLYFLFCPTLIYRDNYPRTPYIRWNYVIKYFAQFLGCFLFDYYVMVHLCVPLFSNKSKQPFSPKTLILSIFYATLPGTLLLLMSFFGFLHCWMNAFAEMLRFADRMFYKDWWNSTSFSNYYRTWNVIIHDWLYHYVYQDLLWLLKGKFRTGVMLTVFLLSASVHEYAFTLSFGFFYPVMFCLFAILGVCFNFTINDRRTSPVFNVIMWTFLFIGQGIQICLYCQEWYARIHCPVTEKTFWGLITPRSWSCYL